MTDYKNIPLGLRTQTQIPLDVKEYIQNESLLSNLGVNGQLAYTYTKGLVVYCIEESTRWEWTEVKPGLEDTGLINQDFIYSDNHIAFGIDYSNKRYNFFPYNPSPFTVPDATTTIKGILKLANDLGGTADLPTTPTAIHKTGNETKNGNLGVNSLILAENPIGSVANEIKQIIGGNDWWKIYGKADGLDRSEMVFEVGDNGEPFSSVGQRYRFHYEAFASGTSKDPVIIDYNDVTMDTNLGVAGNATFLGSVTANSYIKPGGTSTQMLMADGSVKENQDNLQKVITTSTVILDIDNNHTIFINNGTTPVTITINSSITIPNFCVGFIQEGTGDVTFVGSGVSLTNPVGLKSKGQGYQTFIERKLATSNYFLLGNTRA